MERTIEKSNKFSEEDAEMYFDIIEHSSTPLFAIDKNHIVIIWNKACERLTGVSKADIVGTDRQWTPFYPEKRVVLADLVVDNNLSKIKDFYRNFSQPSMGEGGLHAEGWYPNLGGSKRYIFFSASAIKNSKGEVIGAVETLEDITDRRLSEEENIKHLSQTVAELGGINDLVASRENKIAEMQAEITTLKEVVEKKNPSI